MSRWSAQVGRWLPALMAAALIVLAVARSSRASWLFVTLGAALLVKGGADAWDRTGSHRRSIALLYLAIAALGLVACLLLSSR